MTVNVDDHEELTDVVAWVYLKNKWHIGQTRIIIHNVGDINYTQLISGNVHSNFPVLVEIKVARVELHCMSGVPLYYTDLSYNDWETYLTNYVKCRERQSLFHITNYRRT